MPNRPAPALAPRTSFALAMPLAVCLAMTAVLTPTLGQLVVNWRESDVLMVGRNLCRGTGSLLNPRIDHLGAIPRITGMELPLLNAVEGTLACGGDGQVRVARLLTLVFGWLGVFAIWAIARRHFTALATLVATVGLGFSPVYLYYSRTIQPDVPALALALLALVLLDHSLAQQGRFPWAQYCSSALLLALGALIKLPVLVFGLPLLVWVVERRGWAFAREPLAWLYPLIALIPPLLWYAHARRLQEIYGSHYFFLGDSFGQLVQAWRDPVFYQRLFVQRPFDSDACPALSVPAITWLLFAGERAPRFLRGLALGAVVSFFLGGWSAAWHTSYSLPLVPALALGGGAATGALLTHLPRGVRVTLTSLFVVGICGYGVWRIRGWGPAPADRGAYQAARRVLDIAVPQSEPLVVVANGDPKLFWYFDRRGEISGLPIDASWMEQRGWPVHVVALDHSRIPDEARSAARRTLGTLGFTSMLALPEVELWMRKERP